MSANPVSAFVLECQSGPGGDHLCDLALFEQAANAIVASSHDGKHLARYRRTLDNACAWLEQQAGGDAATVRRVLTRALGSLVETLLTASGLSAGDREIEGLTQVVKSKAHAARIFRELSLGARRPADLEGATGLVAQKIHRVLNWGVSAGLVHRWENGDNVVYGLTSLGELALQGMDEPAWLRTATMLTRIAIEARLLKKSEDSAEIRAKGEEMTGLTEHQVARSLHSFLRATDHAATSRLAAVLRVVSGERQGIVLGTPRHRSVRLFQGGNEYLHRSSVNSWWPGDLGTSLVHRALERAGVPEQGVEEWSDSGVDAYEISGQNRFARSGVLNLDRPIISVSDAPLTQLSSTLLEAFGTPLEIHPGAMARIWSTAHDVGGDFAASDTSDFGFVLRLYSESTRVSHFLIVGLGGGGTYGACRYFYENVEQLMASIPVGSFVVPIQVPRHARRDLEVFGPYPVRTSDPGECYGEAEAVSSGSGGSRRARGGEEHAPALAGYETRGGEEDTGRGDARGTIRHQTGVADLRRGRQEERRDDRAAQPMAAQPRGNYDCGDDSSRPSETRT